MTQDDYKLFTGETVNYSKEDWAKLVGVASTRLASFLCLDAMPEFSDANRDLEALLANFIAACLKFSGTSDTVASKSVRNFTISFKNNATNAFEQIYNQFGDVIEKYSACDLGIKVENSKCYYCQGDDEHYGYLNF